MNIMKVMSSLGVVEDHKLYIIFPQVFPAIILLF